MRLSAENAFIASSQHSAPPYFLNMVHRAFLDVCGPSRVISKASPHCPGSDSGDFKAELPAVNESPAEIGRRQLAKHRLNRTFEPAAARTELVLSRV